MNLKVYIPLLVCLLLCREVNGQEIAVKSNLLYDATATVNIGMEIGLAPRWTLDLSGNLNAWDRSHNRRWKHWLLQPEARYWFCDCLAGHFLGFHLHGGQYNAGGLKNGISFLGSDLSKLTDQRYQGWFLGAGVAYGYAWVLGRHWNLEAELGLGYAYTKFDVFRCAGCGKKTDQDKRHHYLGPTKAAINLVYLF